MKQTNQSLRAAKALKNDEFYTRLIDIEVEVACYEKHFRDKVVYCNCDNPTSSAFWEYFHLNFERLGIKELVSTYYDTANVQYKSQYTGGNDSDITACVRTPLVGDGDFRSEECVEILGGADLVVTNPPFSLFRVFIETIMQHGKKFLVVGNKNAITYKNFFPLLRDGIVWLGQHNITTFLQPDGTVKRFGNIGWYTNLVTTRRCKNLVLSQRYYADDGSPRPDADVRYPHYDNYDAINVDRVCDIPCDYYGVMGVPITFLDSYNPSQMQIIGASYECPETAVYATRERERERDCTPASSSSGKYERFVIIGDTVPDSMVDGAYKYRRIFIKREHG